MKNLAALAGIFFCSSVSFATTLPPARPTNLTATAVSSNQIKLSWTDNSNNETGVKIERSRNGTTFRQINAVGVNVTAYTDSVSQASTKYYYRVRAYNSGGNSGYSNTASATTAPSPTPSPTASPRPTPAQNIWIAIRTDRLPGSGTQADPYDGSTPAKFDGLMNSFQYTPNLGIHLVGPGPFRTYASHNWVVCSGWIISGDGIDSTTMQMVGNVAGLHFDVDVFKSDPNVSTDNVTIKNLTVDCNWAELSRTADTGVNGEKYIKTGAVILWGSNNLIDHVRCINSYGSFNVGMEEFPILLIGSRFGDATNDVIQYCRVESPQGTHMAPFGLAGWLTSAPTHLITNSKVIGCTAVGVNSGVSTGRGFASGGVNLGNIKDCQIDGNTFIDCYGAAYIDTGSVDGLQVTNNTVIRGWQGVGICTSTLPRQNIQISGNNFSIQNRVPNGASYGMTVSTAATNNLTINNNTITFDPSGAGLQSFWGICAALLNNVTVSNNTIGLTSWPVSDAAQGIGVTLFNNRHPDGTPVPGL